MLTFNLRAQERETCKFNDIEQFKIDVDAKLNRPEMSRTETKIVLIGVHGFNNRHDGARKALAEIAAIMGEVKNSSTKIIALSWPSSLAGGGPFSYMAARRRTKEAGERLAYLIKKITDKGIVVGVFGHSLGTVVIGEAALCMLQAGQDEYLWNKTVFFGGDARLSKYEETGEYGTALRMLGISSKNYFSKYDRTLNIAKWIVNGKRIGRNMLKRERGINCDASGVTGEKIRHRDYRKKKILLQDAALYMEGRSPHGILDFKQH